MPAPSASLSSAAVHLQAGRFEQARGILQRHLAQHPRDADACGLLSSALLRLRELEPALFYARRAADLRPDSPAALGVLGYTLFSMNRDTEAAVVLGRAAAMAPRDPQIRVLLVHALVGASRFVEAYEQARIGLESAPDHPDLTLLVTHALINTAQASEAVGFLRTALARRPGDQALTFGLAHCLSYDPGAGRGEHFAALESIGAFMDASPLVPRWAFANIPDPDRPLRIGVISPDLREHPIASFIEPWFVHHDRQAFQIHCYSTAGLEDNTSRRLKGLVAAWHNAHPLGPAELVSKLHSDRLDMIIELSGHTLGNRLLALHARPAPVQVTYLGYPNTTGLRAIDYRIVDSTTDPPGAEAFATEKLVRLDPCFLCYQAPADAPAVVPAPSVLQPGAGGSGRPVTFGSFNAVLKINDPLLAVWAGLLARVPGSRLVLKSKQFEDTRLVALFRDRVAAAGIEPGRVDILPPTPSIAEHLGAYAHVDVALDTCPYNGTTTTCEALWMGVPVVTLEGDRHASRVGASLLSAAGLTEFIAKSADEYVAIAAGLAADSGCRAALRGELRARLAGSALCDARAFADRFQGALRRVWRSWCASPI
jgi:protein O-GlcNAc transferase